MLYDMLKTELARSHDYFLFNCYNCFKKVPYLWWNNQMYLINPLGDLQVKDSVLYIYLLKI